MFRFLIVDDSMSVHAYIKMCLLGQPCEATYVNNGQKALELLSTNQNFDMILLDWEMPVMDGPTTFSEFTKLGIKIPVAMMTTRNAISDIQKMLEAGISEYLIKPFTVDIFREKLERAAQREIFHANKAA